MKSKKLKCKKDYEDLFEKFKSKIEFNSEKRKYTLSCNDKELSTYFECDSIQQANLLLKTWIHELEQNNIEDEIKDDSKISFFKIKYFMDVDPINFTHPDAKRKFVGLGNSNITEE